MTIDEWADRYRRIAPEFSCEPGAWNTKRVPYLRAIMRACSPSDPCQRIIFAKPSQVGGTEVILNTLGYLIDLNPRSVLVIFPTVELAQSFSRERPIFLFRTPDPVGIRPGYSWPRRVPLSIARRFSL